MLKSLLRRLFYGGPPRRAQISEELWADAVEKHPICHALTEQQQTQLRERAGELLGQLHFQFVGGVPERDELKLSVALQAALPVLELGIHWYRSVRSFVIVPQEYEIEQERVDEAGVVHEGPDIISGEYGMQGPVVLSLADVDASGWGEGYNVVIHELAHVLDITNGDLDGTPALPPSVDPEQWRDAAEHAYQDHIRRVQRAERAEGSGRTPTHPPILDPYGAEGPEEFFACACELFFESPGRLRRGYQGLYQQLVLFFGFDPSGRS
jgi:hypothetical protein